MTWCMLKEILMIATLPGRPSWGGGGGGGTGGSGRTTTAIMATEIVDRVGDGALWAAEP